MNDEVDAVLRSFAPHVGESEALCKVLDKCALEEHRGEIDRAFAPEEGDVGEIVRRLEGMGTEWADKVRGTDGCYSRMVGCVSDKCIHFFVLHHIQTLKLLRKASPTALQVTLRALREGARLPLDQTFPMEYRLSQARTHGDMHGLH